MVEGFIAYDSFYYTSEHIKQFDDTPGGVVWDDQQEKDKREGELLQMNTKMCMIKSNSLIFCHFSIYIVLVYNGLDNIYLISY